MDTLPLTAACPSCGSEDITYTCEPNCCFNHLCGKCYQAFELASNLVGEAAAPIAPTSSERDTLAPTVPCARCESLDVFEVKKEDEMKMGFESETEDAAPAAKRLICTECRALLELEYREV